MKEATGEANITVITIVLIAIVLAVGTIIVTQVLRNTKTNACCTSVGGTMLNGTCYRTCTIDPKTGKATDCSNQITTGNDTKFDRCVNNKE